MNVWISLKNQAILIGTISFFLYNMFLLLFLKTVNDEERDSINKDLGKPLRKRIIFFFVSAVFLKAICIMMVTTVIAIIIKDYI
jgi:hypothetical protein